jgi:hypothetical protein
MELTDSAHLPPGRTDAKPVESFRFKWVVFVGLILYLLLLENGWNPILLFESPFANHAVGLTLLLLPAPLGVAAFFILRRWQGIVILVLLLLVAVLFLPFAFFEGLEFADICGRGGENISMEPCSEAWQGAVRVRAFTTSWGMGGGFGTWVRQERRLLPGLLLVRDLYHDDNSIGSAISFTGPGLVHVIPNGRLIEPFDIKLRSFVPLCGPRPPKPMETRAGAAVFESPILNEDAVRKSARG